LGLNRPMQLYRLLATNRGPSQKRRDYTGCPVIAGATGQSFFSMPASAANGLWVALAMLGVLVEPSLKYC